MRILRNKPVVIDDVRSRSAEKKEEGKEEDEWADEVFEDEVEVKETVLEKDEPAAPLILVDEESLEVEDRVYPEVSDCQVKIYAHTEVKDLTMKKNKTAAAWQVTLTNGIVKIAGHEEVLFKSAEQVLAIAEDF